MKLYVVRHGETDWNKKKFMQGNTDVSLNETGISQAKMISEKLKDVNFDVCYSSPLSRAYDTASIICNGKVNIQIDNRLEERELGEYEGKESSLYNSEYYWNLKIDSSDKGVESPKDLLKRISSFYDDLLEKHNDEVILIVSHGAIVRGLNFVINGYDENTKIYEFDVPNCCVFEYEI